VCYYARARRRVTYQDIELSRLAAHDSVQDSLIAKATKVEKILVTFVLCACCVCVC